MDQDNRCLEWVRAGHDPGIFYDPARGLFEDLAGPGLALGVDSQWNYVTNRKEGLKEGQIIALLPATLFELIVECDPIHKTV